jgi:hypothetical protein
MGCWNGTCAITNLPIYAGEKVYVFFLREGAFYDKYIGNHCDPDNYYSLDPLYFEGEYNDYGSVENITGDLVDVILDRLKDELVEMEQGENQYHDVEVKKEGLTLEKVLDIDHESRLFVVADGFDQQHGADKQRLTHITIRKGVLDRILETYKWESYVEVSDGKYEDVVMSFSSLYDEDIIESIRLDLQKAWESKTKFREMYVAFPELIFSSVESAVWRGIIAGRSNGNGIDRLACRLASQMCNDPIKFKALMRQVLTRVWLNRFYNDSRRMWFKPSGCGSQNSNTEAQRIIAQVTMDGIQDMKQYGIDNGWEEDE